MSFSPMKPRWLFLDEYFSNTTKMVMQIGFCCRLEVKQYIR